MCFYDHAAAMAYQLGQWKAASHEHHRQVARQAAIENGRPSRLGTLFRKIWRGQAGEARR